VLGVLAENTLGQNESETEGKKYLELLVKTELKQS
jgi:hypothetical protein